MGFSYCNQFKVHLKVFGEEKTRYLQHSCVEDKKCALLVVPLGNLLCLQSMEMFDLVFWVVFICSELPKGYYHFRATPQINNYFSESSALRKFKKSKLLIFCFISKSFTPLLVNE